MDRYTKTVLTAIAILLGIIAFQLYTSPVQAISLFGDDGPTYGDMRSARSLEGAARQAAVEKVRNSTPLVYVEGGSVSTD